MTYGRSYVDGFGWLDFIDRTDYLSDSAWRYLRTVPDEFFPDDIQRDVVINSDTDELRWTFI